MSEHRAPLDGVSDTPQRVGVPRRTAYALAVIGLDVVHRATIRAMLPKGVRAGVGNRGRLTASLKGEKRSRNKTSEQYQDALRTFEARGWITRGREFLQVLDRQALFDNAVHNLTHVPQHFIDIENACRQVRGEIRAATERSPQWLEQRRQELLRLQELMRAPIYGQNRSGRRSVRFVPRGRSL